MLFAESIIGTICDGCFVFMFMIPSIFGDICMIVAITEQIHWFSKRKDPDEKVRKQAIDRSFCNNSLSSEFLFFNPIIILSNLCWLGWFWFGISMMDKSPTPTKDLILLIVVGTLPGIHIICTIIFLIIKMRFKA